MSSTELLSSLSPSLSERLKQQTGNFLSKIVKANYTTQFAQTAPELSEFRDATAGAVDGIDTDALSDSFRKTVPLTTYDAYAPFTARLFESPCRADAVDNLLAPGLPDYIVGSSSTSSGRKKFFPKYNHFTLSKFGSTTISHPIRTRTNVRIMNLWCEPRRAEDENGHSVKAMYYTSMSGMGVRETYGLHPDEDAEKMGTFIFDHATPYAAGFITKLRSFLLIHVLFGLATKSLETMVIPYASTFVDMMHHLDTEFDTVVGCIANGSIPDLDGIAEVRQYLEMNMVPDPERAAELRALGRPSTRPGWCGHAWPKMHSIKTTASGSFATFLPSVQSFLGPNIAVHGRTYASAEAMLGRPCSPGKLDQYKLNSNQYRPHSESVVEFLDVNQSDSVGALAQIWEVDVGKAYEIVLTTPDGLWRYRLGDIIEIVGFSPSDGAPIIRFIERRNMTIRFPNVMVTEKELSMAISTLVLDTAVQIVGWTAMIDQRRSPATVGFFVELSGDLGSDLACATDKVFDELLRLNERIAYSLQRDSFGKPTIRLVQHGTFSEFLQLKLNEAGSKIVGQAKVPAVLFNAVHATWFLDRVVQEL